MKLKRPFIPPLLSPRSLKVLKERMKEKQAQAITMFILTLAALSLFGIFAISPTLETIASLQRQLEDRRDVTKKLQTKINNLTSLQQQYVTIEKDLPLIDNALPTKPTLPLLIGQLHAVAESSNLAVTQIQITNIEIKETPSNSPIIPPIKVGFSLVAEGTYKDIQSFLKNLSKLNRIVKVEAISTAEKSSSSGVIQLNITGSGYYMP